jgi:hypothetical protein
LSTSASCLLYQKNSQIQKVQPSPKTSYIFLLLTHLSLPYTSTVKSLKDKFEAEVAELSAPVDDPVYLALHSQFIGAILYDFETRASWKLYRVLGIQFIRSYASHRPSCWEATCEPVYRDTATGLFHVPSDQRVADSTVIKTTALQGYALPEYPNGLDTDPTYLPWVAQYYCSLSPRTVNPFPLLTY